MCEIVFRAAVEGNLVDGSSLPARTPREARLTRGVHFSATPWAVVGASTPRALVGVQGVPSGQATPRIGPMAYDFRHIEEMAISGTRGGTEMAVRRGAGC